MRQFASPARFDSPSTRHALIECLKFETIDLGQIVNDKSPPEDIFFEALARDSAEAREAFVSDVCGADSEKRQIVAQLLSALSDCGGASPIISQRNWPDPSSRNQIGNVIEGRYKLLEVIGSGGMGSIYRAQQIEPVQRQVALKLIRSGMDSQQVLARFEAERQALALMDHPNIAKVLDAGTTDNGQPFFVMELVNGLPMTAYCDQQKLTVRERLALFIPVCQAIQHAHQKGIIHRDIKPNNILVGIYDEQPISKVIDFGIAKSTSSGLTGHTYHTVSGSLVGTPEYMSPEQAGLQDADIDTRSDIYSLGVVLYELLTATTPLKSTTDEHTPILEMLRCVRENDPPTPSRRLSTSDTLTDIAATRQTTPTKLTQSVAGELDWIVMKALDKDRDRRYESASDFAKDIQRFLDNEPVEASPAGVGYRVSKFVRRHRAAVITTAGVISLLLGAVAVSSWLAIKATRAERLASDRLDAVEKANDKTTKALAESEESRKAAIAEAAISTAVNSFLNHQLLGQADIRNQFDFAERDPAMTVRTLLDRAAAGIENMFPGQELTEAAIRLTIGRAYFGLGIPEDALKHVQRSVELYEKNHGTSHATTLAAHNSLALALQGLGRFADAEQVFLTVIAGWRSRSDHDPSSLINVMHNLGLLYQEQTRYGEAEKQLQLVLEHSRRQLGETHPTTRNVLTNIANVHRLLGRYDEAEPVIRENVDYQRQLLGADHPTALQSSLALASLLQARGQYSEAAQIFRTAYETSQKKLGLDHCVTLTTANNLAMLEIARSRFGPAENLLRPAMERCIAKFGDVHPQAIDMKSNLAGVLLARGRLDEAEKLLLQVLPLSQSKLGPAHETTNMNTINLAQLFSQRGRHAEAEPLLIRAYEAANSKLGPDHSATLTSMNNLAIHYMKRGRHDEAEVMMRKVINVRRGKLGPDHPKTLEAMNNLGYLFRERFRLDEAEAMFTETLKRTSAKLGDKHETTMQSMNNLASLYVSLGRYAEAEPLFVKTLNNLRETFDPNHPHIAMTKFNLALVYHQGRRFDEAESLYREALVGFRANFGPEHAETYRVMTRFAMLYHHARRIAEAEPLLRECVIIAETKQPDNWIRANMKALLGSSLLEQGKVDEAEPHLLQGYESLVRHENQIPKEQKNRLTEVLESIVKLYDRKALPAEGAKWKEQLNQRKKAQP